MRTTLCVFCTLLISVSTLGQSKPPARTTPTGDADSRPTQEILADAAARYESYKASKDQAVFQEVISLLGIVLRRDPTNSEANLMSGEISLESNDFDTGRKYFRSVLDVEPNNYRANVGLGKIWIATRSFRQAALFLQTAERVAPDAEKQSAVKQLLATAYVASGDVTKAIEKAEEAVRIAPNNVEALNALAVIRIELAKRDPAYVTAAVRDAETFLARAREVAQQDPANIESLRRLDLSHGMLIDALRQLHNSFFERDARSQATTRIIKGKEADAAAALNRVAEVMMDRSTIALTLAQHDIIKVAAQPAVQLDPKSVKYLETLASLYEKVGDRGKAIETAQQILQIDPNHQGARDFLNSVGSSTAPSPAAEPAERR